MDNKVINILEYKLNKLDKRFSRQADTNDKLTESKNNYNKEVEKSRESLFKDDKQSYKDLMKHISGIKKEPIFDWKRRKSTL